jgi:hypothetical protein
VAVTLTSVDDGEQQATWLVRLAGAKEILASAEAAPVAAIGQALLALTEAPHAAIFFRSPAGLVTCAWSHKLSDAYLRRLETPNGVNPWFHIMRHPDLKPMDLPRSRTKPPEPSFVRDIHAWPSASAEMVDQAEREGFCAICSWPLCRGTRVLAAVAYYYGEPHVCSEAEQEVLRLFAQGATTMIEAVPGVRVPIPGAAPGAGTPGGQGMALDAEGRRGAAPQVRLGLGIASV